MNKKTKKTLTIAGIVVGALVIVISASLLIRGCVMGNKYTEYYEKARASYLAGEYDAALGALEEAIKYDGKDQCYLLMADIYVAKGDISRAIDTLQLASYSNNSQAIKDKLEELKALREGEAPDDSNSVKIGGEEVPLDTAALILTGMGISDISDISRLKGLTSASLQDNSITDISPLQGMTGLTFLNLSNNRIKDVSPIGDLNNLKTLYLDGNQIENFSPLYSLKSLTTLSLKSMDITSAQLENLKKELPGCGIYTDDVQSEAEQLILGGKTFMSDAAELDLSGLDIGDISVLEQCTQLTKLNLDGNKVNDLTPLMNIQGLSWLSLGNNEVGDIRPLMSVTGLTYLNLAGNKVKDITPLSFLPGLEELYLGGNELITISTLGKLPGLSKLGLNDTGLKDSDLDTLKNIKTLVKLNIEDNDKLTADKVNELKEALSGCSVQHSELRRTVTFGNKTFYSDDTVIEAPNSGISDISGLENFTKVKKLLLSNNTINDIKALKNMPDLEVAELRRLYGAGSGGITDIDALSGLSKLRVLDLTNNSISSLSPLKSCTALTELYLDANKISDISAIKSLSSLTTLSLGYNSVSDLSALSDLKNLRSLCLDGNSFTDITALKSLASLQTLSLMDTKLTYDQIVELQLALPQCMIDTNAV